jgi:cytochrome c biogenesis factor
MLGAVCGGEGELGEGENTMFSTCFIFYHCPLYFCSYSVHSLRGSVSVARYIPYFSFMYLRKGHLILMRLQ